MEYYEWVFLKSDVLVKWAEQNKVKSKLDSIPDFFRICLLSADRKDLAQEFKDTFNTNFTPQTECFVKKMWKKGRKQLAIGQSVQNYNQNYFTIKELSKNYFISETDEKIPYLDIRRIPIIPEFFDSKFSIKNIKRGMKLRLVNKRKTGNVYTVLHTHQTGFDAQNGKYIFLNLEYSSVDKILKGG